MMLRIRGALLSSHPCSCSSCSISARADRLEAKKLTARSLHHNSMPSEQVKGIVSTRVYKCCKLLLCIMLLIKLLDKRELRNIEVRLHQGDGRCAIDKKLQSEERATC